MHGRMQVQSKSASCADYKFAPVVAIHKAAPDPESACESRNRSSKSVRSELALFARVPRKLRQPRPRSLRADSLDPAKADTPFDGERKNVAARRAKACPHQLPANRARLRCAAQA